MSGAELQNPAFELPDGRRFVYSTILGDRGEPHISELRPVVDQAGNRLYAFDQDGEGFLLQEYGGNKNGAIRAAEFFWGKPSQETWGHIGRPVPTNYDELMFELMSEHGPDALERISSVQCVEECCSNSLSMSYDKWRLSSIERGRIFGRAVLFAEGAFQYIDTDDHMLYKTPGHLDGDKARDDQFIRMVQMFGEPFDQTSGEPNPIYIDVLEQYRDNA